MADAAGRGLWASWVVMVAHRLFANLLKPEWHQIH